MLLHNNLLCLYYKDNFKALSPLWDFTIMWNLPYEKRWRSETSKNRSSRNLTKNYVGQVNLVRNINIKQLGPSLLNPTKVYQKFASKWAKMIWSILSFLKKKKRSNGPIYLVHYVHEKKAEEKRLFSIFSAWTSRDKMSFGPEIGF